MSKKSMKKRICLSRSITWFCLSLPRMYKLKTATPRNCSFAKRVKSTKDLGINTTFEKKQNAIIL
jgi:hypothetical protein